MDDFIARENIRRFEEQLRRECDSRRRTTIEGLLDVDRKRLQDTMKRKSEGPQLRVS